MAKKNKKRPKTAYNPDQEKIPRIESKVASESYINKYPTWRFGRVDFEGFWGWNQIEERQSLIEIHRSITNFESMTWAEIERKTEKNGNKQNHPISISAICKDARDRLRELKYDDIDELYSLRLSGKERLWGMRDNDAFYILWWDPKHTVCPVPKKYT